MAHNKPDLGKALRRLMAENQTSNSELATALECSIATISAYRNSPDKAAIAQNEIATFFEIRVSEFIQAGE